MALNFKNLKDPKLGMLDKITFGKLKDCRVCDVIQDHYEYLIWAEKQGYVKYQQIVIETIHEHANFEKWEDPDKRYADDKHTDTYEKIMAFTAIEEDDVPF